MTPITGSKPIPSPESSLSPEPPRDVTEDSRARLFPKPTAKSCAKAPANPAGDTAVTIGSNVSAVSLPIVDEILERLPLFPKTRLRVP